MSYAETLYCPYCGSERIEGLTDGSSRCLDCFEVFKYWDYDYKVVTDSE